MKRKISSVGNTVLEKMNYSNGSIVSKWQNRFPKKAPPKQKKVARKPAMPKKVEEIGKAASDEGPVLRLIKQIPIVFQLRRNENPADFDRMAFVVKAISKDPGRPHFAGLHIEQAKTGCCIVACDGRRLHVAEISQKISSGDYKPVMTKDAISLCQMEDEIRFPNWQKVVPDNTDKRGVIDLENAGFGKDQKQTEKLALAFNAFLRQTGETINLRYLEDLTKKPWAVYCQSEKGKAVILKESGSKDMVYAVMMPLPPEQVEASAMAMAA
jgi:hypothetical protein